MRLNIIAQFHRIPLCIIIHLFANEYNDSINIILIKSLVQFGCI